GSNFDDDPQLPWAIAILADTVSPQSQRIDQLHREGWEFGLRIETDFQPPVGSSVAPSFVQLMSEIQQQSMNAVPSQGGEPIAREISRRLNLLFPAKYGLTGDQMILELGKQAVGKAMRYGIMNPRGIWLLFALMFVLGAGFDSDPQFP